MLVSENPSFGIYSEYYNANKQTTQNPNLEPKSPNVLDFFSICSVQHRELGSGDHPLKSCSPWRLFSQQAPARLWFSRCALVPPRWHTSAGSFKGPWHSTKLCYSQTQCQFNTKATRPRLGTRSFCWSCSYSCCCKSEETVSYKSCCCQAKGHLIWVLIGRREELHYTVAPCLLWGPCWFLHWLNKALECDWWPYK